MAKGRRAGLVLLALVMISGVFLWACTGETVGSGEAQTPAQNLLSQSDGTVVSGVFSPAHRSMREAIRHFLGLRDEPTQPIAFSHQLHTQEVGLGCEFCHNGVSVSPVAGIPGVETCMLCHSEVGQALPEVQSLVDYHERGVEPAWQRVYGWTDEAHVRFTHQPHYDAGIGCQNCHGNVESMGVAERAVEHSMRFCVNCHVETGSSFDCVTCHY